MLPLAQEYTEIVRSQKPETEWTYSPHILKLDSGRILASYDISCKMGYIKASDDGGKTWDLKAERTFYHGRLFRDKKRVYMLGHFHDLVVVYSDDDGETWSKETFLTDGEWWHQAPHYASMDIDGDDLIIASRSGDKDALSAHYGNILTFHRVKNFRNLVY